MKTTAHVASLCAGLRVRQPHARQQDQSGFLRPPRARALFSFQKLQAGPNCRTRGVCVLRLTCVLAKAC
eukprot:6203384-Pleurochrysis_carterae.AAC.1